MVQFYGFRCYWFHIWWGKLCGKNRRKRNRRQNDIIKVRKNGGKWKEKPSIKQRKCWVRWNCQQPKQTKRTWTIENWINCLRYTTILPFTVIYFEFNTSLHAQPIIRLFLCGWRSYDTLPKRVHTKFKIMAIIFAPYFFYTPFHRYYLLSLHVSFIEFRIRCERAAH